MPFIPITREDAEDAPDIPDGDPLTSVGMTLDSMSAELLSMLGGRQDISSDRLTTWINASYLDLCTSLELSELRGSYQFSTVADQPLYGLPDAVLDTIGLSLTDPTDFVLAGGTPATKRSLDWYRRAADSSLSPTSYFPVATDYFSYNKVLVLWPTPIQVNSMVLDFSIRPGFLVDPTDSPILPLEWHWAILLGARSIAHEALLEWDMAAPAQNSYVNYVRRRTDRKAEEDTGRIPLSSVPRSAGALARHGRGRSNINLDLG